MAELAKATSPYAAGISAFSAGVDSWLAASQARSDRAIVSAQNATARSGAAVSAFIQSLNNNRVTRQAQYAKADLEVGQQRQRQALTGAGFNLSIRNLEQQGAASAAAGVAGLGPRAADAVQVSMRLRADRNNALLGRKGDQLAEDHAVQAMNLASQINSSMDYTTVRPNQRAEIDGGSPFAAGLFGSLARGTSYAGEVLGRYLDQADSKSTGWTNGYDLGDK